MFGAMNKFKKSTVRVATCTNLNKKFFRTLPGTCGRRRSRGVKETKNELAKHGTKFFRP